MSPSQFQSLLNNSSSLDKLKQALEATKKTVQRDDEGFWKLTTDKQGNGFAIVRFLPAPPPETVPFVSFYRHAFQGPNGWYIENSRTSINEADPLSEYNSRLWATKDATLQDQVRKQSRKQTYVANIYIVKDQGNPENEGKVFLFRFGKKIFEKIVKAANPDFEGDTAVDPFNLIEGANFRLRQKKQAGFPNYDDSTFEAPSKLLGGDEKALERVCVQLKSLQALVAPEKFKPYDDLKKKLDKVFGFDTGTYLTPADAAAAGATPVAPKPRAPRPAATPSPAPTQANIPQGAPVVSNAAQWTPPSVDESDEDDSYLEKFEDED